MSGDAAGAAAGGARPARPGPRGGWAGSLEAPGKRELVTRGFALAGLRPGARVLDVGCGAGASVELLRRSFGLRAVGLDLSAAPSRGTPIPLLRADARRLPVAGGALDAVLLECVLSLVPDRQLVLRECARALSPGGSLVVTDLHAREGRPADGVARRWCGAELLAPEALLGLAASAGFEVLRWEDHSSVLKEYALRLILEAPGDGASPPGDCVVARRGAAASARARPGFGLLVARRRRRET